MARPSTIATTTHDAARLLAALDVVTQRLHNKTAKQGESARYLKYSPIDFQALRWLAARERPTPGGLAKYLDVAPTTITSLLDRLTDKDLVSRAPSTRDRRRISLALTAHGKRAVAAIAAEDQANCAMMLDVLDADAREGLLQSLEVIAGHSRASPDLNHTVENPKRSLLGRREKAPRGKVSSAHEDKSVAKPRKMATDRVKPSRLK